MPWNAYKIIGVYYNFRSTLWYDPVIAKSKASLNWDNDRGGLTTFLNMSLYGLFVKNYIETIIWNFL